MVSLFLDGATNDRIYRQICFNDSDFTFGRNQKNSPAHRITRGGSVTVLISN